ncbi:MAG: LemA family protein [Parcubacteria group bacterium]|nr:LemA family protein [Parcubacteria group bacterium]
MSGIIFLIIIIAILLWGISIYNGLITSKNRTQEAWADIDVQLKRRHDLIPNLIETVKGYSKHESEVFRKVTEARAAALAASGTAAKARAENALNETLKSLFAISENYPELKASQNFLALQDELSDTENKIQSSRRFYNANVRDFNTLLEVFPQNLIAGMINFKKKEFFEIADINERETPSVKF